MEEQERLVAPEEPGLVRISGQCYFRDAENVRVIFCSGIPLYTYDRKDRVTEKHAVVALADEGLATQRELGKAFGYGTASIRRWQGRYEKRGVRGLDRKQRDSAPLKMDGAKQAAVRKLFHEGWNNSRIAQRIGVSEITVRRALRQMGLTRARPGRSGELALTTGEETGRPPVEVEGEARDRATDEATSAAPSAEPVETHSSEEASDAGRPEVCPQEVSEPRVATSSEFSLDTDPTARLGDRFLARVGCLDDAMPMFASGRDVKGAGLLLAVPLIVSCGVLGVFARLYGSIGPAFYGLRTTVMTLLFMSLGRIKRPENLKEHNPVDLGRVLGLDRAPEVKTLRRKLRDLADLRKGVQLMRELARRRLKEHKDLVGFLYVDGHVRAYHGKGKLAKGYVTQRHLAAPATTDYWVNDAQGGPVFVVTSEVNASLTKILEPVLDEVQAVVGKTQRLTAIFDRGGWSPKLFARLIEGGIDLMTYRKGKSRLVPVKDFREMTEVVDGKKVTYMLHDTMVGMGKTKVRTQEGEMVPLRMRQVTRLREDGKHQTQVLTTRQDLTAVEVLYRMFNRWRQENFFKYMKQEYEIDALVDYTLEPVSAEIDRPNPKRSEIDRKLRTEAATLKTLEKEYGARALDNAETDRRTMRGFKIANGKLGKAIRAVRRRIQALKAKRATLPERVSASDLQRLSTSRKVIVDALKMTGYQIENELVNMVWDHYPRAAQEGHKLIVSALASSADIDIRDGVMEVTLAPQSSPHRTRAIAELCSKLTARNARFPGTDLRLRYAVRDAESAQDPGSLCQEV